MKKYTTPTIEALALETIDVISISGGAAAMAELKGEHGFENVLLNDELKDELQDITESWKW